MWQLDFVNFDDPKYVTENAMVSGGVTSEGIRWALGTGHASNWHPVTWVSHMLDAHWFGLDPAGHHLVNLLFHLANSLLLFWFLARATGSALPAAFVALLFAIHPLHVESVAWISERKDVLSTFFMLCTLLAWMSWTRDRRRGWYLLATGFLVLGLMSKPMLVTLPFVLLLLDAWPLSRLDLRSPLARQLRPLVIEKLPLFMLVAVSSYVTYQVQSAGGAVASTSGIPLLLRAENALLSWVLYIKHLFWPAGLAAYYPYPSSIPAWQWLGSLALLSGLTYLCLRARKNHPFMLVGWLWYLGTSIPVIGLVQVGNQAMADRYTYIPMIGLAIIMAWGGKSLFRRINVPRPMAALGVLGMTVALALATQAQTRHWQDGMSLWTRALAVTQRNYRAHNSVGSLLEEQGRRSEAIAHFKKAIEIEPRYAEAHNKLGAALAESGRPAEALEHYRQAVEIDPGFAIAWSNLGVASSQTGEHEQALTYFGNSIALDPDYAEAHNGRGYALDELGRLDEAESAYRTALQIDPALDAAHSNLAVTLFKKGQLALAIESLRQAVALKPDTVNYHVNLGLLLSRAGDRQAAAQHLQRALQLEPGNQAIRQALEQIGTP